MSDSFTTLFKLNHIMKAELLTGRWLIQEMEEWDEDYFNSEGQAYIEINEKMTGNFKFGLVAGELEGDVYNVHGKDRFEFTWFGMDEDEEVFGFGWIHLNAAYFKINGEIRFHRGESSKFAASKDD